MRSYIKKKKTLKISKTKIYPSLPFPLSTICVKDLNNVCDTTPEFNNVLNFQSKNFNSVLTFVVDLC